MDNLSKYLQEHKASLDVDEPSPRVWDNIQLQATKQPVKVVSINWLRWAAAACIVALAGIGVISLFNNPKQVPPMVTNINPLPTTIVKAPIEEIIEPKKTNKPSIASIKPKQQITTTAIKPLNVLPSTTQNQLVTSALTNIENQFVQVVNMQKEKIKTTPLFAESANYFSSFKQQMKQLDKDEIGLRQSIKANYQDAEMLEGLINIYQEKLNLLKLLQIEMNKLNNRYKQNKGPVDTTKAYFIHI